jgi:CRISPR/Cas system-associated exonuclease Cas4 (RecB family)
MKPFDSNKILTELDYKEIVNWGYTLGYLNHSKRRWFEWERVRNREKTTNFRNMAKFFCETLPQDVEITAIEKELRFKAEGINFFGIVDLVLKYPDGHIEIVDYKTGMRRPTKEQLEIYAIPFSEDGKKQLPISFRVICPGRKSHYLWTLSPEKVEEKRERILDMVRVILNDTEFKPTSLAVCRDCGVKNACNYGGKKSLPTEGENIRPFDLTRLSRTYEWKPAPVGCRTTKSRRPYLSKATKSS